MDVNVVNLEVMLGKEVVRSSVELGELGLDPNVLMLYLQNTIWSPPALTSPQPLGFCFEHLQVYSV